MVDSDADKATSAVRSPRLLDLRSQASEYFPLRANFFIKGDSQLDDAKTQGHRRGCVPTAEEMTDHEAWKFDRGLRGCLGCLPRLAMPSPIPTSTAIRLSMKIS